MKRGGQSRISQMSDSTVLQSGLLSRGQSASKPVSSWTDVTTGQHCVLRRRAPSHALSLLSKSTGASDPLAGPVGVTTGQHCILRRRAQSHALSLLTKATGASDPFASQVRVTTAQHCKCTLGWFIITLFWKLGCSELI